jgi:glycosidase
MLTLRGTPFLYYGEEIGMTDLILEDISQFKDRLGIWFYEAEKHDLGVSHCGRLDRLLSLHVINAVPPCSGKMLPTPDSAHPQLSPGCLSTQTIQRG